MSPRTSQLAEILLKAHVIDEFQMRSAAAEQAKWGHRFTRVLGDMRLASEPKVVDAVARAMRLPVADLDAIADDAAALRKLDAAYCAEKGVFPCALRDAGKTLFLAMCDPTDMTTTLEVEQKTRARLKLMVAGEAAVTRAIARCYRGAALPDGRRPAVSGIELTPSSTGEFTDALGDVVGAMRSEDRVRTAPPVADAPAPARDSLSSLFDFVPQALTPAEQARLDAVVQNHERGSMVLRAVLELCVEKGLLRADDVNRMGF